MRPNNQDTHGTADATADRNASPSANNDTISGAEPNVGINRHVRAGANRDLVSRTSHGPGGRAVPNTGADEHTGSPVNHDAVSRSCRRADT